MLKFQLKSGKKLEIEYAPIETALTLLRAVLTECKKAGLDIKIAEGMQVIDLIQNNTPALLGILSSETVLEATKDCCTKNLYDGMRFTTDAFESPENRQDFIGAMIIVAIENLAPFFPEARTVLNPVQSLFLR